MLVMNITKEIAPEESEKVELEAKKLLTDLVNNDQLFSNHIELIRLETPVGRFYGEITKDGKWKLGIPGNYNLTDIEHTSEMDNDKIEITIVPPTGIEKLIIYCIIALGCLIVLAGGIILIK